MRASAIFLLMTGLAASQARVTLHPVGDRRTILVSERSGQVQWMGGAVRGYIVEGYNGAPLIWTIDRRGVRDDFQITVPELRHSTVRGVAAGLDGAIAVIGDKLIEHDRWVPFLARISPDHVQVRVIDLERLSRQVAVAVTGDGRMWTLGSGPDSIREGIVLEGFEPSGKLTARRVVHLRVPNGEHHAYDYERSALGGMLISSGLRIGWLNAYGQYIEFSTDGQQALFAEPPVKFAWRRSASIALSPAGEVYLAMDGEDDLALWWLQRSTSRWIPVDLDDDNGLQLGSRLLGFDGEHLLTLDGGLERGGFLTRWRH
jgi:hypothetical protein